MRQYDFSCLLWHILKLICCIEVLAGDDVCFTSVRPLCILPSSMLWLRDCLKDLSLLGGKRKQMHTLDTQSVKKKKILLCSCDSFDLWPLIHAWEVKKVNSWMPLSIFLPRFIFWICQYLICRFCCWSSITRSFIRNIIYEYNLYNYTKSVSV